MLQFAAVLTTGGFLLFSTAIELDKSILITLINRIIDSKNLQSQFIYFSYKINYLYDAVLGLIFLIAWRKQITFQYPQKLLQAMSLQWKSIYDQIIWKQNLIIQAPKFDEPWEIAFDKWKSYVNLQEEKGRVMKGFKGTKTAQKPIDTPTQNIVQEVTDLKLETPTTEQNVTEEQDLSNLSPRQRFLLSQKRKSKSPKNEKKKSPRKSQQERVWQGEKYDRRTIESLDFSKKGSQQMSPRSSQIKIEEQKNDVEGFFENDEEVEVENSKFFSKWLGKVKNIVGDKKITKEDIDEVLKDFKQKLMEKNVAQNVADKIAETVGQGLLQTKTKSFTTVYKTVKQSLNEALHKILTPKKKIDLVVQVTKEREKLKPYVIVFVGVNGVGKSTNLAKVASKLKNAKLSVMLAACDNFRAGAVEQIKTHGRNLQIPVFDRGYKEQPANIAYQAIKDATRKRIDAVLIDTAGRMQDNQPLMKELARLVKMNKPNLVVFIGEALVGNDAVDQITKFNEALQQESTQTHKAEIDAILLSKFDTVDDKVGTALSLVYSTSKPILFVGVGQKYQNLKELNVNTVVHALLS